MKTNFFLSVFPPVAWALFVASVWEISLRQFKSLSLCCFFPFHLTFCALAVSVSSFEHEALASCAMAWLFFCHRHPLNPHMRKTFPGDNFARISFRMALGLPAARTARCVTERGRKEELFEADGNKIYVSSRATEITSKWNFFASSFFRPSSSQKFTERDRAKSWKIEVIWKWLIKLLLSFNSIRINDRSE